MLSTAKKSLAALVVTGALLVSSPASAGRNTAYYNVR